MYESVIYFPSNRRLSYTDLIQLTPELIILQEERLGF